MFCLLIIICHEYSHYMLYVNKYSHVRVCVCVCIVCKKCVSKTICQVSNYLSKTLTLKLKLKWGIILWIGGVRCLTPLPPVIELSSPRSLV